MKSNYVGLSGCDACGLGSTPVEAAASEKQGKTTVEDTVEEAQKYSNSEVPIWVKVIAGVGAVYGLSKLTKGQKAVK